MEISYVECPRDSWQGLARTIAPERKRAYLQGLLDAGFRRLDLASFVSPRAVPQMADSEEVLAGLEVPAGADLIAIVANERGLARARASGVATTVGYPLSVNDTFQRRNTGRGVDESWGLLEELLAGAREAGLGLVVYLSMGFGNPYGEPWAPRDTAAAVDRLRAAGVERIALADTVGTADRALLDAVLTELQDPAGLGLHLHARPDAWADRLEVALERGLRWFEGALAGVGGCPFAGEELVGNLPTERVLPWLAERGFDTAVAPGALPGLAAAAAGLAAEHAA